MKKNKPILPRRRAMTSEQAREVRRSGHADAKEFASLIGLPSDYQNDPNAKKDVIDLAGDAHSVKSGANKWQIFLHPSSRFEKDMIFRRLNGLGQLFLDCLAVFPDKFEEYKQNKIFYKDRLKKSMQKLKERLQNEETLRVFLEKSFFNAGEVTYLTIKHNNCFNVFHSDDAVKVLADGINVENSKGEQKVIFKIKNINAKTLKNFPLVTIGEIEMRNDSKIHFKEMKFWMSKDRTFELLKNNISPVKEVKSRLFVYGKAIKIFRKYECG